MEQSQADDLSSARSESGRSRLLQLPAEIRAHIFSYVLDGVRCRTPLLIWDDVCIRPTQRLASSTAILLACRTTYGDAIKLLYNTTIVEASVRSDGPDDSFPQFVTSLGAIEECPILPRIRHLELEITYNFACEGIHSVYSRMQSLAAVFAKSGKLKTLEAVFFDRASGIPYNNNSGLERLASPLVKACREFVCERLVAVSRNLVARNSCGEAEWAALREKAGLKGEEQFREISYDYWENAIRWKN